MRKMKKMLSLLLVFAMVLSMAAAMTGCGEKETPDSTTAAVGSTQTGTYRVSVKSAGGLALAGVDVYIYADDTLEDMKQYGETDANGEITFEMPVSSDYAVTVSGAPKGYAVEKSYSFAGNTAAITLTSAPIAGENLADTTMSVGSVIYDFSVVTPAGETVTLSEMLKEKDMVLLNFWYSTCSPCISEFPYMQQAYEMYEDSVGIIALNNYPLDNDSSVAAFQSNMGLTFPMAKAPESWSATFGLTGYPTSIVVDRYGVICLMEMGGLPALRPFTSIFEHFTAENYEQKLFSSLDELTPAQKPTLTMPSSEEIGAVINSGDVTVSYRPETEGEDAEYAWPFVIDEKNGESCIKASNQLMEDSYAILYADVTLKAGEAIGFDYLASSELGADVMHVIVDDEPIYTISGVSDPEVWQSCYPWVAEQDGTYELALCYIKDGTTDEGDDTVYIKNMRVAAASEIDVPTYLPREAANSIDGFDYEYVDVVLNEQDGYYHVGTKDGPLLLANLQTYSQFSEEETIWDMTYNGDVIIDGVNYYDKMVNYFSYASNSSRNGVCTVNEELAEMLKDVADVAGFSDDENEWLKICYYYQAYGTGGEQLVDPIKGLAPFSAYEAKLGVGVESNYFYYRTIIMPRGYLAKFVPTKSGVYRITSHNDSQDGVEGWIFDKDKNELYCYEQSERMFNDDKNVSMLYYMEAGEEYYIDIAFWDYYHEGYIYYDIEYVDSSYEVFRLASPGYFTYDSNATGDAMYYTIAGGIDVVLGDDGIYYEKLEDGSKGSKLYCDFTGLTALFSNPISTVNSYDKEGNLVLDSEGNPVKIEGMIDMGGFDFSKTSDDLYILSVLEKYDGDQEAAVKYLKESWGEDYDANAEAYMLEEVLEGIYHGTGGDLTEEMRSFEKYILTDREERTGCVVVTERLAEILQLLMDKYTFAGVEHSWTKLCYYYDPVEAKD